jgi:hypothetical protein
MLFAVSHHHDTDEPSLTHECTICSVASHLDDVDAPAAFILSEYQHVSIFTDHTENRAYIIDVTRRAARAPPAP